MEDGNISESSAQPDLWGSAVANGDAMKLASMVLEWSHSKPDVALSLFERCVALLEKDIAHCGDDPGSSLPPVPLQGSAQTRCLDAFTVALNQMCDGKTWYTSTKELQLASMQFCCACRSVTAFTLTVDDEIPRRLLAAVDAPRPNRKRLCSSRVPRLRARRVWWALPTAAYLTRPIYSFADATEIFFDDDFVDSLNGIAWPQRLKKVWFRVESRFNRSLEGVEWPDSVQKLEFGEKFDQPISAVRWPSSLQQLTFGLNFNQPIESTEWPITLLRIEFGFCFDQPIEGVTWPNSVRQLSFDTHFDRPVRDVRWPASLQELTFGNYFNQPLDGVVWPSSLRKISLGDCFNQPIEGVAWADSTTHLSFGQLFNQPIARVAWPACLEDLSFGLLHDDPTNRTFLISFFNQAIGQVASLRRLSLGHEFRRSLEGLGAWMPNLEELCLLPEKRSAYESLLDGVEWPAGLRKLTVFRGSSFQSVRVQVPQSVQIVYCRMSR